MAPSELPRARQSQLVTTYGVGSLFPAGDQSFMICGIDEWDEDWCPPVEEPRLARALNVQHFRAPATGRRRGDVPVVRFPMMHYCPQCRRLDNFWKFDRQKMRCEDCSRELTPSRFVACCENGHIEEFPYFQWLHRGQDSPAGNHQLTLKVKGVSSSLADIEVHCTCGVRPHNLDGSFARHALAEIKSCSGARPWLPGAENVDCDKPLRTLQRGSSNVWFAEVRSSISIPPWSSPTANFVTKFWDAFKAVASDALPEMVQEMVAGRAGVSADAVLELINERRGVVSATGITEADLRADEYKALVDGNDGGPLDTFLCTEVDVDPTVDGLVAQVSRADRLREVRALYGFTRVTPSPTDTTSPELAQISHRKATWLPATEVLGEGVFLRFDGHAVEQWISTPQVRERHAMLEGSVQRRSGESGATSVTAPTAKFLTLHSFAHALLEELSLDAGYPAGSMRERIYADDDQYGVLVYTASSDAAGSLGGLAALAQEEKLAASVANALSRASWCSNDPVCVESGPSGADGLNLAACHACLLLPETSCEHRNIFLDRAVLQAIHL